MAKISSYTTVTPPALTDRVIGTDSVGTPTDSTKNFLIGDIVGLVTTPDLSAVLTAGNSASNNITLTGSGYLSIGTGASLFLGQVTFSENIIFTSTITAGGGVGTAGQVLTSQGAGVSPQWLGVSVPIPTITQVLNAGDNAGGNDITFLNSISTDNIVASGAAGVLGQLMQSTGGGITWVSSVNLTTVQTDNLIIDGGTITADGSTGTAGQVLASTVTGVEWVAACGGGGGLTWVQKTAAYTAVDGDMVGTRLVSTGYTISPPTSPALGMRFGVQDMSNLGNTYNITIDFNTQGTRWNSQASDLVLTKDSFCVIFEWVSVQVGWALVGGGIQ